MAVERPAPPVSGDDLREEVRAELIGALNAVLGFSQILAADDPRLDRCVRQGYSLHVRESGAALRRLVLAKMGVDQGVAPREAGSGAHPVARVHVAAVEDARARVSDAPLPGAGPRIFVIDGDERSRALVAASLEGRAYQLHAFATCREALDVAQQTRPDLVLMEAAAPEAFATVGLLQGTDAYLSVVFLTDLGDERARERAFEHGAEQILEKPIARHDVRARARNLLNLRKNQQALAAQNEELRRLQAFKDEMAALMVHDLKSPLSAIAMNLDVALSGLPEDGTSEDVRGALEDCRVASARLFRMIANLLDIAKSEDGHLVARPAPVDLRSLITKIAQDHVIEAKLRKVNMTTRSHTEGLFEIDADLVGRVVENLIENGLRYTRPRGNLLVVTTDEGTHLEIRVANDGPPIPEAARAHIFEKYGQAQTPGATRVNRGLGLYFCRVAAEAHGGTIALADEPSMTTCFCLRLPRHLFAH